MYCSVCRSEFREGITRCASCDVALVEKLPFPDPTGDEKAMAEALADRALVSVVVGQVHNIREAQAVLKSAKIPSLVAPEADSEIDPGMHPRLYLLVAQEQVEEARAVFESQWMQGLAGEGVEFAANPSDDSDESVCPACGTALTPNVTECGECGLFLGAAEA